MAMVGSVWAGMEVVDGMHAGQSQDDWEMSYSWKGLNTGHHKKALVCCPCCWLAALHGAPRTLVLIGCMHSRLCLVNCVGFHWAVLNPALPQFNH